MVSTSETRNPKPETRNPKPETDSEDLPSALGPIETRNPKTRNPKPETDSEDLTSPGPIETRNPKPETRNPKPTLKTYLPQDRSKPETRNPPLTRNPKPETDSESGFQSTKPETRNPKPETRNRQRKLVSSDEPPNPNPEPRNPKPTAKVGFKRRNLKLCAHLVRAFFASLEPAAKREMQGASICISSLDTTPRVVLPSWAQQQKNNYPKPPTQDSGGRPKPSLGLRPSKTQF